MAKQIFRERALEKLSSPAQLDQLMSVTNPAAWVALAGAGVLLLVVILWSILGTLQTTVDANGVLTRPGGVTMIYAPCQGEVQNVLAQEGALVQSGEGLMHLVPEAAGQDARAFVLASPLAGRLIGVAVREGDQVASREPLAAVERLDRSLRVVVYMAASEKSRVRPGTPALVSVGSAGSRDVRPLSGRVERVGPFPATLAAMQRTLQSEQWAASLSQYGPMLEVVLALEDEQAAEKYSSGTPCQARLIVEEKHPIQLILGSPAG